MLREGVLAPEHARVQLAGQAGLASGLDIRAQRRPVVCRLENMVSLLPTCVHQLFMCVLNDVFSETCGRNDNFSLLRTLYQATSHELVCVLEVLSSAGVSVGQVSSSTNEIVQRNIQRWITVAKRKFGLAICTKPISNWRLVCHTCNMLSLTTCTADLVFQVLNGLITRITRKRLAEFRHHVGFNDLTLHIQ